MNRKLRKTLMVLGSLALILATVLAASAEQVTWNNDSIVRIQDNWWDVDGTPLEGSDCNFTVFFDNGTIVHQGAQTELAPGLFNFSVPQITQLGIFPLRINCSKEGYNGTSSKDSLKIIDELTEDFKDSIDQTNLTVVEINETTHMTYDLLTWEINDTLQTILSMVNFTKENLTRINEDLDKILGNTSILVDKWGSDDADRIIDELKDLRQQINDLTFRFKFVSDGELEQRTLSIFKTAKNIDNKLNEGEEEKSIDFSKLAIWVFIIIVVLVVLLYFTFRKNG